MPLNIFQRYGAEKIIKKLRDENAYHVVQPFLKQWNALNSATNLSKEDIQFKEDVYNHHQAGIKTSDVLSSLRKKCISKTITKEDKETLSTIKALIEKGKQEAARYQIKTDAILERAKNHQNQSNTTQPHTEENEAQPIQKESPNAVKENAEENDGLTQEQIDFEKEVIKNNREFSNKAKAFISSIDKNDPDLQNQINDFVNENADFFGDADDIINMIAEDELNLNLIEEKIEEADRVADQAENNISFAQKDESSPAEDEKIDKAQDLTQEQIDFEKEVIKVNSTFSKEAEAFLSSISINDPDLKSKIIDFVNSNSDFFGGPDEVIEMIGNDEINLNTIQEKMESANHNIRTSENALGYGYVQKANDEKTDPSYNTELDITPPKTFKNSKGVETTYQHYDASKNTAIINFDTPITEIDASKAGYSFDQKTGKKYIIGEVKQVPIAGVQVKLNKQGVVDFSLPENKGVLSYPTVCAEIIKLYPESFKSLPPVVYASNPNLFASSFKDGTIKKVESGSLGNENAVNYYENANLDLSEMAAKAKGKGNEMQDKAIANTIKQVNLDNEIEREF